MSRRSSDSRITRRPARAGRVIGSIFIWLLLLLLTGWGIMAILYSDLPPSLRPWAAGAFGLISLLVPLLVRPWRRGIIAFLCLFALLVAWWLTIPPSNNRDWQQDVAVLPWATFAGEKVTIHSIRNCDYRSETDYTCRYYDRTFDLDKLKSVDGFLVYWGSQYIAHTMLSFGFEGQGQVCFSIETRKEKGEEYSAIKGFFKQYELTYIVADERDVVRLRTNYRKEDVYLYRLKTAPEQARKVFLDYLREVNRIHDRAEWYNALVSNCTTNIRGHTAPYSGNAKFDWRIIVNGFIDKMMYERGTVNTSLPFAELKKRSYINAKAQRADKDRDFSRRIREGLPEMER
ncbi:MAG: DUF4105 domain-containing protein [Deltaproteobacteria bacterium]|nr:DUF4105 domain-containing protein [Deltaproteobacteria bacterium]